MTFLQAEGPLRLKIDGFRKPLRLRSLGRDGALETFAVEGQARQAVRFFPSGAVREIGGRLTAVPEAAEAYAAALDAFETLGQRLQTLAPRAVLKVEAVARTANGGFWLQSPPGVTLEAWLADHPGPVSTPLLSAFARRLAQALGEVHTAGLVHGDLSPRAVLIDGDEVRLTGFMVDRRPFFRALRSQEGLVESGYAPPEAHDGALRQPIGPAADLYAASALLQRLLTGHAPPAANLPIRLAGENAWPDDIAIPAGLRAGIDAGLAPATTARPASAEAWLAGLDLGPEPKAIPWFDAPANTLPSAARPAPAIGPLGVPAMPFAGSDFQESPEVVADDDAPLSLTREAPRRRRLGWWVAGAGAAAAAVAAIALVAPRIAPLLKTPPRRVEAPRAVAPVAPAGCQWLAAAGGWRLRCADAPAQGLQLPERFDAETTARAAAGEPAAMERLGAFYRLRAAETNNPNRGAYAYQALGWLQRAAATADDGRPDTARARDDAALALGQMLAHGEGGRAPDPSAAEARLRQAAAGSRADAVLALGQLLETQSDGDADRLDEARGLYARVAQLGDHSLLQREAERGLARIDAAVKPPAEIEAKPKPPVEKAVEAPVEKPKVAKPSPKPAAKAKPSPARPPVKTIPKPPIAKTQPPRRAVPVVQAPPRAKPTPSRPIAAPPAPAPVMRTWTASNFIKVDPTTNFSAAVELAGRAACDAEGGQALSVRTGDTICPNGVNYCQVRAVATCQGARP